MLHGKGSVHVCGMLKLLCFDMLSLTAASNICSHAGMCVKADSTVGNVVLVLETREFVAVHMQTGM